jgi:hypothetical protein
MAWIVGGAETKRLLVLFFREKQLFSQSPEAGIGMLLEVVRVDRCVGGLASTLRWSEFVAEIFLSATHTCG